MMNAECRMNASESNQRSQTDNLLHMNAVEFITELNGASTLVLPEEVASRLPKSGRACFGFDRSRFR